MLLTPVNDPLTRYTAARKRTALLSVGMSSKSDFFQTSSIPSIPERSKGGNRFEQLPLATRTFSKLRARRCEMTRVSGEGVFLLRT